MYSDWVTGVVFSIRKICDIKKSQERINWDESPERIKYNAIKDPRSMAEIKYGYWQKQKKFIIHFYEINFDSLKKHKLWISEEERKSFDWCQTDLNSLYSAPDECGLLVKNL